MSFGNHIVSQMAWNEHDLALNFPLHKACKDGDHRNIPLFLSNNALLARLEDCFLGWTPAHWAAYFGQTECLMSVLQYVVPSVSTVDIQASKSSLTPAHCAAQGGHSACLRYLLGAGANPNAKLLDNSTDQELDTHCSMLYILKTLLDILFLGFHQDATGETPLHKACRIGNGDCVRVLVESSKDTRVSNNAGQIPSAVALVSGFPVLAHYITKYEMMNELGRRFTGNGANGHRSGFYQFQNAVNAYVSHQSVLDGCRKRSLDSDDIGSKKMRSEDVVHEEFPSVISGSFNFAIAPAPAALSSVVEHESLCRMDTGYSDAFLECMISQFHGC